MDIRVREHLERQPGCNKEWIDRYILFIESVPADVAQERDRHHILPKAVFPVFESFEKNPWNCKPLSYADHFRAHCFLFRALPNEPLVYHAFWRMVAKALYRGDNDRLVNELADRYQEAIKSGLRCHWEEPVGVADLEALMKAHPELLEGLGAGVKPSF